jgi:surface polysaccharide O-acyltransferase-like enzyme
MSNSQDRIFGYDLIKTIAIIMIVFYHLGGIDYGSIELGHFFLPNFNKFFSAFCAAGVPLFFLVNGALVIHKNKHWKQLLLKAFHLLFLLFFWKFVLQYLISNRLLGIQENMVHFWFLGTLSIVYSVSIVLHKYSHLRYFFLIFLLFFPFLYNFIWDIFLFLSPSFDSFKVTHTGFITLYAILYYYLGDYLSCHQICSYYSLGLILLGLILVNFEVVAMSNHYQAIYDGVNSSFPTLGALAISVGIFFLLKNVSFTNGIISNIVSFVGQNTMGTYIFHVFFIILLRQFCSSYISNLNYFSAFSISVIIILFTALISSIIRHSRVAFLLTLSSKS